MMRRNLCAVKAGQNAKPPRFAGYPTPMSEVALETEPNVVPSSQTGEAKQLKALEGGHLMRHARWRSSGAVPTAEQESRLQEQHTEKCLSRVQGLARADWSLKRSPSGTAQSPQRVGVETRVERDEVELLDFRPSRQSCVASSSCRSSRAALIVFSSRRRICGPSRRS
ncbi:hypothetical protein CUR178_08399 [Leishmania enriettii]|uniref:Uncharacterized protein n=1 Tax=Leishmania enriettii TaxID=5663 RepID=A0A836GRT6_LEIEN|nr:hypothetical protein CUR178_08399 [Leishmania enriettii]